MKSIKINNVVVGYESDTDFPFGDGEDECGLSSIVISHGVVINEGYRGQGFGKLAHVNRLDRWKANNYHYALCTVRRDNDPQLHILKINGWVRLANTASNNGTPIYIMGRSLK